MTIDADELKSHLPTIDVVAAELYSINFRRNIARCPFHQNHTNGDRDPSLRYDAQKNRIFCASQQCFGENGVDAIGLIQQMDHCDFQEALRRLADFYGAGNGNWTHHYNSMPQQIQDRIRTQPQPALKERERMAASGYLVVAEYEYGPELRKVRYEHKFHKQEGKSRPEKTFRWEHKIGQSWYLSDGGKPKLLYANKLLRDQDQIGLALGVEGENKADIAVELGYAAFSYKDLSAEEARRMANADVVLWPDNDEAGARAAMTAATNLAVHARSVKIIQLPEEFPTAGDIVDAVTTMGWQREHIQNLIASAPVFAAATLPNTTSETLVASGSKTPVNQPTPPKAAADWTDTLPLREYELPQFPGNVLPDWLGNHAEASALATETPAELAALLDLAVVAACAAKNFVVSPEAGYVEPVNIWTAPAMESGNRKTAVLTLSTEPLLAWEREQAEKLAPEIAQIESERKTLQARIDRLRKDAANPKNDMQALQVEISRLEATLPEVPSVPRLWTEDVTAERVAALMAENDERIAILSDEGGIYDLMGGRYSNGVPNLDVYLKAHAGSHTRVDRTSRPAIFLRNPALTFGLSPQPEVLRGLVEKPGFRGRGLIARFLFGLPASQLGYRSLHPTALAESVKADYATGIRALLDITPDRDSGGLIQPTVLQFTPEAYREWKDFQANVERMMRDGGTAEHMRDWASKLPGAAVRIAGNLHVAQFAFDKGWDQPISRETILSALTLAAILVKHALAVFELMLGDPKVEDARRVLRWITNKQLAEFTARDCFCAHQTHFRQMDALRQVLPLLVDHGYIRPLPRESVAHRPSETYLVHPSLSKEKK